MTASSRKFRLTFLAVLGVLILALVPAALAAKGGAGGHKPGGGGSGGGGGGTVSLSMVADTNGNGAPNFGDEITYNVSTSATAYPYVSTQCYQGRTHVLSASAGYYPSYAWPGAETVALQSGAWTGGGASCTATLYSMDSGSQATLATLSYTVGA